jgi:hypothetical protein
MNTDAPTTTTIPADPTPVSPAERPGDLSQLERQFKNRPKFDKVDYKSLAELPESAVKEVVPTSVGLDIVPEQSVNDFLKAIDTKENTGPIEDEPKEVKKAEKVTKQSLDEEFDLSDLDLSKDPEPVTQSEQPKTKKSKEDNLAELRKKAEAAEMEIKTRDEKLAEYQSRAEALEAELERTAFERSPKFQEKFAAPYQDAITKATEWAKDFASDESLAEKALSLKGKERIEFIDENFGGGAASAQFLSLINDADSKRGALEQAVINHKETASVLVQDEEKSRQATTEKINRNFERVANHLANKSEFFRKGEDDDHNKMVDDRISAAKNIILGNASENDMAVAPFLAVIAKDAVAENAKLKAELAKYKARAAKDAAVAPSVRRGSSDEGEVRGKPRSATEAIRSYFR